ncbi:DNA primase [Streptomyces sp. NPDC017936]|uniref:DNA primase n=1 Tax=Streptomyces sp. NPDC017936 TaxID=3365016 RepID=UPI0037B82BB5
MNRTGMGLAIGAGYVLGRTKKLKMALAVGSLVAGKKLNLTPRALADLLSQQLRDNPQFKEIGDQLRQDLRGVGKAASGGLAERQINALADRLHSRTSQVRDQLAGVAPDVPGATSREDEEEADEEHEEPELARDEDETADEGGEEAAREDGEDEEPAPRKPAAKKAPEKKAPAKKAAKKAPARAGAAAKRGGTAVRKTVTKTASRSRGPKRGDE